MRIAKAAAAAIALAALLASSTAVPASAEGTKIAVIDVGRILNESEAGKAAKKKLEARFEELRKSVDARKDEAQKAKEDLEKLKVLVDKDKGKGRLREKEESFAAKVAEYEKARQEAEKEMQGRQVEMGREILKVVEGKVMTVVAEEKIDILLDGTQGNSVLHVSPSLDITEKVLAMVNKDAAAPKEATGGK
jgi:outer membrane protein